VARVVSAKLAAQVQSRANFVCEYCKIPEQLSSLSFEVDHIIARIHGGNSTLENLAWTCPVCNLFKGTNLTSIDRENGRVVRLFNPRRENWHNHFALKEGLILPLSAIGRVTVFLLRMNSRETINSRRLYYEDTELS
jgi:hypothetical protein